MDRSEDFHKALFSKTYSRNLTKKSSRNSGLVPTTLAEPSDSILSSPKQVTSEHFVSSDHQDAVCPNIVVEFLSNSEFVFEDEIDDEISKEIFEQSEENMKIEMNRNNRSRKVSEVDDQHNENMLKKTKQESRDEVGTSRSSRKIARDINLDDAEFSLNSKKRSCSRSSDISKSRNGATSKRVRKCSEEQVVVQVKEEKIMCTKCKETFDPSEFRRHNRIEHEFKCDQENCDYFLESSLALINHKKKIHMIEPNNSTYSSSNWQLVCEACGRSIQGNKWEIHKTTDHPFPCEVDCDPETGCFMRFLTESELARHVKIMHKYKKTINPPKQKQSEEVQVIACVPKIKKQSSKKAVKTYPATTLTLTPLALRPGSPMGGEEYWICYTCTELFENKKSFDNHEQKGEKKHAFHCNEAGCVNAMGSNAMLLKHVWDVHGIKKGVRYCDRCKDVVDVKSWAAHDKKPHQSMCGYEGCGAVIASNKLLWQHMIKKHGYGRIMNQLKEEEKGVVSGEEELESDDEEMSEFDYSKPDFDTSLELDVDEIENDVIREEDAKSKTSVESFEYIDQVVEPDEGEFIKCKVCELLFTRGKIQAHCNKLHKFKCIDGCDLAFTQEHLMYNHCFVEHNNMEHIAEKGYLVCPECSEFFEHFLQNSFDVHVKNGKHLTCMKCEKKFGGSRKDEFNFHCDYAHSSAADIPCDTCDLQFTSSDIKLQERHARKKHMVGPCPHCKQLKNVCLLFVTKERFAKHHEQEHSTLSILGCECMDKIARNVQAPYDIKNEFDVKCEDAYDLSQQITDESSIDEEFQFDYKNFKTDVSGVMKDGDPTDHCLDMYFDTNPVSVKDEIEADLPFKDNMNVKPIEVEISVPVKVDADKDSSILHENKLKGIEDNVDKDQEFEFKEIVQSADAEMDNFQEEQVMGNMADESDDVVAQNILEVLETKDEVPDIDETENVISEGNHVEALAGIEGCSLEIQDNSISTTGHITITSQDVKDVPVEELIDSDPEVSSSYLQAELDRLGEDSKDSDISHTDSENVENLIGITKQEETEKNSDGGETMHVDAIVNIAPEVKRETKNSPFNLVPYVDTDSDCDSIEDHEKRAAAGKLAVKSLTNDDIKHEQGGDRSNIVETGLGIFSKASAHGESSKGEGGEESVSRKHFHPSALLKKVIVRKVCKDFNVSNSKLSPREVRSVSSDAQIVCTSQDSQDNKVKNDQPSVIEVNKLPVEVEGNKMDFQPAESKNKLDLETIRLLNDLDNPSSSSPGFGKFLVKEASPSREEISRAFNRIKRNSGEDNPLHVTDPAVEKAVSLGFKFSFAGKVQNSLLRAAGPPSVEGQEELVNFSTLGQQRDDEYTFSPEMKTEQDVGYQSLVRPGKVGRKKPCKSALSHETEETQMQADIARQQEIKRINRTRQMVVGKSCVGPGHSLPGSSVLRCVQATTSVIRQVPRQPIEHLVHHQQSYQAGVSTPAQLLPVLNTTSLKHIIPQDPMQFVTIPSTSQSQHHQSSKRPPAGQSVHNWEEKTTDCEQQKPSMASSESAPAVTDGWQVRQVRPLHTYRGRRSIENRDHSYVMDMDCDLDDDFDLSEKLEEMEKDFDQSDSGNAGQEESLEAIKCLLDSQVFSQKSSKLVSSQGATSFSDGDEMGLYSPGDDPKPCMSESIVVLDDSIPHNNSVISINSEVSIEENVDNILSFISDKKTVLENEVKVSSNKIQKSQDETYDDVDDLLGDSDDDDDDQEQEKKEPAALPIKVVAPSEPSKKKPPQFVCPECNQKYGKNEKEFNNHIRQKHNFPCKFCPLKFTYVNGLEEHSNSIHMNETAEENSTSFCCNICNKSFTRQGPYLKHKKRDHNIPCIECDMVFTNEPFLEEHMARMHGINSPPSGKMVKMRKPTSPVEVKFQLANGMINDSPKKIIPKEDAPHDGSKKDLIKKATLKLQASKDCFKKGKPVKSIFKKIKDISVLSEDDTICEKCGQKFEELEAFEHHIELAHEHQCGMKSCELSFVYQYYLDLHIFEKHKTGIKPDGRDRPIEESVKVTASSHNESAMEDQISLADLAVSEDYLPGIGPQSMMCGGDPTKVKSLKGYKIPKKSSSPGNDDLDLSLDSSLNSSMSSHDNTPVKFSGPLSPERNSLKCHQCDKTFSDRVSFNQHIANHYNHGKNVLGSPSRSLSNVYKCHECNLMFKNTVELDNHVSSHYSPSRQQSTSQASSSKRLKCPLCTKYFDEMAKMMVHLKANHHNGRNEKKHDFWCGRCRKGFETEKKFEDHEKLDHKYSCNHCHKAYILEVDLNHHVEKNHKIQTKHKEGFTCQLCGVNISEMEMFKIHQSQGHNVPCYLDGCEKRFQHKKELLAHLKSKHNIVQIRIGDDSDEEHRGYLTTERSQANIDIAEWAESWIDSPMAVDHMVKVMKGVVKSRRHDLFLDKRERDQCSGSETSRLYQLSNPGFLGGGGEKDTVVIKHLIDRVFMVHFQQADQKLKDLGNGSAFVYTSCVLFPETFIHQHQVQGKSREEAEQAFMEVAVDVEERKGLNQEIKEAAVRNRRDSDEDSGDEWVDHSDMEEDMED